ncbi:hypothetical protein MSAN_02475500 [Mycena sanguinolenta]|uniref:Uncharacterized protein n=1 Tax=Mycena sanguinolenta TaxID=230812 RepID=A0A8H6U2U8_9AGAR|nr:hypothetical protein MSAN_02475500 [Mycena sanguinolenta]
MESHLGMSSISSSSRLSHRGGGQGVAVPGHTYIACLFFDIASPHTAGTMKEDAAGVGSLARLLFASMLWFLPLCAVRLTPSRLPGVEVTRRRRWVAGGRGIGRVTDGSASQRWTATVDVWVQGALAYIAALAIETGTGWCRPSFVHGRGRRGVAVRTTIAVLHREGRIGDRCERAGAGSDGRVTLRRRGALFSVWAADHARAHSSFCANWCWTRAALPCAGYGWWWSVARCVLSMQWVRRADAQGLVPCRGEMGDGPRRAAGVDAGVYVAPMWRMGTHPP